MKIICKKNYKSLGNNNLIKGNKYQILSINSIYCVVFAEKFYSIFFLSPFTLKPNMIAGGLKLFHDYFYTKKELRKIKLNNIKP